MEEGIFPHQRSFESLSELEEERRLCYVGITRAKSKLYLLSARKRTLYGKTNATVESRFIKEIDSDLINITNTAVKEEVKSKEKKLIPNIQVDKYKGLSQIEKFNARFNGQNTANHKSRLSAALLINWLSIRCFQDPLLGFD